ncbi:tyrosine-type recombinase/integrase [Sphaerotilaceae bacterium SBD11-9]
MWKHQALTEAIIKAATPATTGTQLTDGAGLYLKLNWKTNTHAWRFDFVSPERGTRSTVTLGEWPVMKLADARYDALTARRDIAAGVCPLGKRKRAAEAAKTAEVASERKAQGLPALGSFKAVAEAFKATKWVEDAPKGFKPAWSASHAVKWERILESHVFPRLGARHVSTLDAEHFLDCIGDLEQAGKYETAKCVYHYARQVMDYAVIKKHCKYNPVPALRAVVKRKTMHRHYPAPVEAGAVADLLKLIDSIDNDTQRACVQVMALTWQRPGNVMAMEAAHVNFAKCEWRIPSALMKRTVEHKAKGHDHIVPLCTQAVVIIKAQMKAHPGSKYVFPALLKADAPITKANIAHLMKRTGMRGTVTPHGFRAMARTMLEELHGFEPHVLEHQLAHGNGMKLGTSYARATHLPKRAEAVQVWGDYLDTLRNMPPKLRLAA